MEKNALFESILGEWVSTTDNKEAKLKITHSGIAFSTGVHDWSIRGGVGTIDDNGNINLGSNLYIKDIKQSSFVYGSSEKGMEWEFVFTRVKEQNNTDSTCI